MDSWDLYFPDIEYKPNNGNVSQIEKCKIKLQRQISAKSSQTNIFYDKIELNLKELEINPRIYATIKALETVIRSKTLLLNTETALNCIRSAISDILFSKTNIMKKIELRIITSENIENTEKNIEIKKFSEIIVDKIESFVYLKGTVVKVSSKKVKISRPIFRCTKCKQIQMKIENTESSKKKFNCFCKNKKLEISLEFSEIRDFQEIKLQEYDTSNINMLDLYLFDDLVGKISPGDVLSVSGIVKAELDTENLYKLVIHVNNFTKIKSEKIKMKLNNFSTNSKDFKLFAKISKNENLITHFTNSIFPNIIGYSHILQGLILSLFGGTRKFTGTSKIRPDIHILLIGDPGLGKSKMLLDMVSVIPRSTYVCGTLTTTAGLTISLTYENGDFVAEAGALVISDGGICAIDEFDKMPSTAVLEAMEDQIVSVAKGGVVCSIPSRATIIAAANPKFGRFDNVKNKVSKNRKLEDSWKFEKNVISRFDLVFILKDSESSVKKNLIRKIKEDAIKNFDFNENTENFKQQEKLKITENEIKNIKEKKIKELKGEFTDSNSIIISDDDISMDFDFSSEIHDKNKKIDNFPNLESDNLESIESLNSNNLKSIENLDSDNFLDNFISNVNVNISNNPNISNFKDSKIEKNIFTKEELTKYLIHARNSVHPILLDEAKAKIEKYFQKIVEKNCTLRTLESLVRLTEASAKMYLRNKATLKDAEFAIKIFEGTMISEVSLNENNNSNKKLKFVDLLKNSGKKEFYIEDLKEFYGKCDVKKSFDDYIEILNNQGVLIKKDKKLYKFTS